MFFREKQTMSFLKMYLNYRPVKFYQEHFNSLAVKRLQTKKDTGIENN